MRRYLAVTAVASLAWEFAHLPLYTIWREQDLAANVWAALHCTGGDLLIATASLVGGLVLAGSADWPRGRFLPVAALTVAIGLGYTVFSEYANTTLRGTWAYTDLMPRLPWIGTGLSPILQWLVVPTLALGWARRVETSGHRASTPNPAPTRSRSP
jgi:hypothetical protein